MHVHHYPPFSPPDPNVALEDNLRRAYPVVDTDPERTGPDRAVTPAALQDVMRRIRNKSALPPMHRTPPH